MIFRLWTTFLLALLGACAVAWLAALMREKAIRPVQDLAAFFKRQSKVGRVLLGMFFVAMWVIASTKPSNGGGDGSGEGGGGDGGGTNNIQMVIGPGGGLQPLAGLRPLGSPGGGEAAGTPLPRSGGEALV